MFAPMVLDSSNKGDECASAHPFGKDLAWAQGIAAEEFARRKNQLDLATPTGHITYNPTVAAMNRRRRLRAKRTTRCWVRGNHSNAQASSGALDLLDQHLIAAGEEAASLPSQPRFSNETTL